MPSAKYNELMAEWYGADLQNQKIRVQVPINSPKLQCVRSMVDQRSLTPTTEVRDLYTLPYKVIQFFINWTYQ